MPALRLLTACVAAALTLVAGVAAVQRAGGEPVAAQEAHRVYLPAVAVAGGPRLRLRLVSQVGGRTHAIVADGRRAWAGAGSRVVAIEIGTDGDLRPIGASEVLPGVVEDLALAGGHVAAITRAGSYLGGENPNGGLFVLDVSAPEPRLVGALEGLGAGLTHLAATADVLFVTDHQGTVRAIDVADPARPRVGATVALPGGGDARPCDAVGDADHLYVLQGDDGSAGPVAARLAVFAAMGATAIGAPSVMSLPGGGCRADGGLDLDGDRLYVRLSEELVLLDVSDPDAPVEVPHAMPSFDVATVDRHRMYAAGDAEADSSSVVVLDVADPMAPTLLGGTELGVPASNLAAGDGYVFGAGGGVAAVDVREPTAPGPAGACPWPSAGTHHVAAGAAGVYAPESHGIWYWTHPDAVGVDCPSRVAVDGANLGPMAVLGARGLVGEWGASPAGVWPVELSEGGVPRVGARSADLPLLADVAVAAPAGYALSERGLHVIDGSDIDAPVLVDSVELIEDGPWSPGAVAVGQGLLAVAGPALLLFEPTAPGGARRLGRLQATSARDVALHGRLAFVTGSVPGGCADGGLHVLDVADPRAPRLTSRECGIGAGPLAVAGAPGALGEGRLILVGVPSTPRRSPSVQAFLVPRDGEAPVRISSVGLPDDARDMVVSPDGTRLWVADGGGGLMGYGIAWEGR